MSVNQRKYPNGNTTWEYVIPKNQTGTGKQYRRAGFKTKKEAQNAEREKLQEFNKYRGFWHADVEKTTFKDIANLFIEHIEHSAEYESGTVCNYKGLLKNHINSTFEAKKIVELTPLLIQQWKDIKSKETSSYVLNNCIKLLKVMFNYAKKQKVLYNNPFDELEKVPEVKKIRNRFSVEQLKELYNTCKKELPEFYCLFCLATLTGMRVGEYTALTVDNILFERKQINVVKQYTRRTLKDRTKTESSIRAIDVCDFLINVIEWHMQEYNITSGFLFRGRFSDRPISQNSIIKYFRMLLDMHGYSKKFMRVHDLRGQYVDVCQALGLPLTYIAKQVGHARTSTTADIYSQVLSDVSESAKQGFDRIFS